MNGGEEKTFADIFIFKLFILLFMKKIEAFIRRYLTNRLSSRRLFAVLYVSCVLILSFLGIEACTTQPAPPKADEIGVVSTREINILYVGSYNDMDIWNEGIARNLNRRLLAAYPNAKIFNEYMDMRRIGTIAHYRAEAELFKIKYRNTKFDAIITSDNNALDFMAEYRDSVFSKKIPLVFCGYNSFLPERYIGFENFTGIVEEPDFVGSIDLALRLHPKVNKLVFVCPTKYHREMYDYQQKKFRLVSRYEKKYRIDVLFDSTVPVLSKKLSMLNPESLVFLWGSKTVSNDGQFTEQMDFAKSLEKACPVPIYSFWDYYVPREALLADKVISSRVQGVAVADLAIQILEGKPTSEIPVQTQTPTTYMFDYELLKKYKISENDLPLNTVLLNKKKSFYEEYKLAIWIGILIFSVLSGLILLLAYLLHKSRVLSTKLKLKESDLIKQKNMLESVIDAVPQSVFWKDKSGFYQGANRAFARSVGFDGPEDLLGKCVGDLEVYKLTDEFVQDDNLVLQTGETVRHAVRPLYKSDGSIYWLDTTKVPLRDARGNVSGVLGVFDDITERVLLERALKFIANRTWNPEDGSFFDSLTRFISELLGVQYVILGKLTEENKSVQTISIFGEGMIQPNLTYSLAGTPCAGVIGAKPCAVSSGVVQKYPDDLMLSFMQAESYVGMPLWNTQGDPLGVIALVDTKPIVDPDPMISVLHILSTSAANELERKQAETTLKYSEEKYRLLFENITQGFALHRIITNDEGTPIDYRFLDLNQAFAQLLDLDTSVVGKVASSVLTSINKEWLDIFANVALTSEPRRFQSYSDSKLRFLDFWVFSPRRGEFAIAVSDISKRKEFEDELQESKDFLNKIINSIGEPIFVKDKNLTRVLVNDAYCKFFKVERNQVLGEENALFFPKNDMSELQLEMDKKWIVEGTDSFQEERFEQSDGTKKTVIVQKNLYIDRNGHRFMVGIMHDITKRKQMEDELRINSARLRSLIDTFPYKVWLKDLKGRFLAVNQTFIQGYGRNDESEIIGKTDYEITRNEYAEKYATDDKLVIETATHFYAEEEHSENGEIKWIETYKAPLFDNKGQVIGVAGFARNITDSKLKDIEIREYAGKLQELVKTKDKFFSIIAHDLRSPFNGIIGFSELMKEEAANLNSDEISYYSGLVHASALQTHRLLENLLQWSRIQQGKMLFAPQVIPLSPAVDEMILFLADNASKKQIMLRNLIAPDLEACVDDNMFKTIIRNLVSNAIKFTPQNGAIVVDAEKRDADICVCVQDTGLGMDEETKSKLFRLDTNSSKPGTDNEPGTGLGLILCKEFVDKHNGRIWVESEPGKGSRFLFTLPV